MLLIIIILPLSTLAKDPENPEITDQLNDTDLPALDIVSAWFYEKNDEPEYLYTALQVQSLNIYGNAVFSIRWKFETKEYVTGFNTYRLKDNVFRSGDPKRATYWQWNAMPKCEGTTDQETNTITWKVLKSNIGNPKKRRCIDNDKSNSYTRISHKFPVFHHRSRFS